MKHYFVTPGYIVSSEVSERISLLLLDGEEVGVVLMDDSNPLFPLEERAKALDATVGLNHLDITSMVEYDTEDGNEDEFINLVKHVIKEDLGDDYCEDCFTLTVEACFPDNFSSNVIDTYKKIGTLGEDSKDIIEELCGERFLLLFPKYFKERVLGIRPNYTISNEATLLVPYFKEDKGMHTILQEHALSYIQDNSFFEVLLDVPVHELVESFSQVTKCKARDFFVDFTTINGQRIRVIAVEIDPNYPGQFSLDKLSNEFVWATESTYWNPRVSHSVAADSPLGAWVVNMIEEEHASQEYAKQNGLA